MINSATAGSFTRGCAARDLQILMLIEERENTNAVSVDKLSDAMLSMLEARIVCYQGRVVDAMALYDSITQSITPETRFYPPDGNERLNDLPRACGQTVHVNPWRGWG